MIKVNKIIYGSCLSSFICSTLGLMQYIQCKTSGLLYSDGFIIKCNLFYEYGLLFMSFSLLIFTIVITFIYHQKNDDSYS